MTSVQNHLLLLSGNKIISFVLATLLFVGCKTQQTVMQPHTTPERGVEQAVIIEEEIKEVKEESIPVLPPVYKDPTVSTPVEVDTPIENTFPEKVFQPEYNVAVVMPFLTDRMVGNNIPTSSHLAINFTNGIKMAANKLNQKGGSNLNINVFDSKARASEIDLLNSKIGQPDILIGGVTNDVVKKLASFAKQNSINYLSPINPTTGLVTSNSYFIQVNPSIDLHFATIADHVSARFLPKEVFLIGKNTIQEKDNLSTFQDLLAEDYFRKDSSKLNEIIIESDPSLFNEITFLDAFNTQNVAVIIPSWTDEVFIKSVLRKLALETGSRDITVYGMPHWKNKFETIDYSYYERLNLHVSSSDNIMPSQETKLFETEFYNKFGYFPDINTYRGYDLCLMLADQLEENGKHFEYYLNQGDIQSNDYLHTSYDFEYKLSNPENTLEPVVDHIENTQLYMMNFKEYEFILSE